jgi:hypothetical protein
MHEVTPRNEVWNLLEDAKKTRLPGTHLECSLLGPVKVRSDSYSGKLVGVIPDWLKREAHSHGFKVIFAEFREDKYTLEIL